jgi:putative hydrolase of the HAD superfamily
VSISSIKNIIFDLGNVILNINTSISEQEFLKHGIKNFNELYSLLSQSELFDILETGKISPAEFYNKFRELTKTKLSDDNIKLCWNALILDFPQVRLDLLSRIRSKFRTFILSNTNYIHYVYYTNILKQKHNIDGLEAIVEKTYLSFEIGKKKPNLEAYEYVISDSALEPSETLFIDDNKDNIISAHKFGLHTIWLKDNDLENLEIWNNFK